MIPRKVNAHQFCASNAFMSFDRVAGPSGVLFEAPVMLTLATS
jgi:hypothetical protein